VHGAVRRVAGGQGDGMQPADTGVREGKSRGFGPASFAFLTAWTLCTIVVLLAATMLMSDPPPGRSCDEWCRAMSATVAAARVGIAVVVWSIAWFVGIVAIAKVGGIEMRTIGLIAAGMLVVVFAVVFILIPAGVPQPDWVWHDTGTGGWIIVTDVRGRYYLALFVTTAPLLGLAALAMALARRGQSSPERHRVVCGACGTSNPAGRRWCAECAAALEGATSLPLADA
jgi:hypothetical protein